MPVSDETKDCLEQVRKGKPRRFVLLTKGAEIVNLVIYKKGAASKFIKQAKEEGKGVPCYGIITGKGMDITFQLAVSDGFEKQPVKTLVLKKYLEDEADFKCKPLFEIVAEASVALDDEDPLHARFIRVQPKAQEASDRNPTAAAQIAALCKEIGALLNEDRRNEAVAKLDELDGVLGKLASGPAGIDVPFDRQKQTYEALRKKLEPLLLAAQKAVPDKVTALGNVWTFAEAQAAAGKFAEANKALSGLADALKRLTADAPKSDAERFGIAGDDLEKRKRSLAARWRQALADVRAELANLRRGIEQNLPEVNAAKIVGGVERGLGKFYGELDDAVLSTRAADAADSAPLERALSTIRDYRRRIDQDERIRWLGTADAELGVKVAVGPALAAALTEMEAQLQA